MWWLVAFSIPEHNRAARDALRKQLRWLGFAPLYDGLWVSPRDHAAEVVGQLAELGITTATAFRASDRPRHGPTGVPQRAWDLEDLQRPLRRASSPTRSSCGTARSPARSRPVEALVARTRVMDEWRAFPGLDPDLPGELLPDAWPRAAARELFIVAYDLLGPLAAHRVRQIIARYSRDLATRAAYHSSELTTASAGNGHGDRRDAGPGRPRAPPRDQPRAPPASAQVARQAPGGGSAGGEPEQPGGVAP